MRSFASLGVALALAFAGACESFSDADTDGAGNGDADASATADAPSGETSTDAAPATRPCPAGAFCDDFDRASEPELGWSDQHVGGNATLALVEDSRDPLGHSLAVVVAASTGVGGEDRRAFLGKNFTAPSASMRLSFSLRVKLASLGDVLLAQFFVPQGVAFLMLRAGKLAITDQTRNTPDAGNDEEPFVESQLGSSWHRVVFSYRANATGTPELSAVLDDDPGTAAHLDVLYALGLIERVEIGSTFAQTGSSTAFDIDDVKMETTF